MKTLLTIDSYISNQERSDVCNDLINQLRRYFPEYKILLINKFGDSFGLESKVDYYFNYGLGFMVGKPPNNVLINGSYNMPYVYFETSNFICENWMPTTGITDHVGGIYNSFVLSTKIAKSLNYDRVYKIEFDTIFDESEIEDIKIDIEKDWDYIIYGERKEGQWAKENQYLIDVHICGYSVDIFENYNVVKNDDEYWTLCGYVGYYGKWIEYLIPAILEKQKTIKNFNGLSYSGHLDYKYPKTKFDVINGEGGWTEKWKNLPKICRVSYDEGNTEKLDEVILFFYNNDYESVTINTTIYLDDKQEEHHFNLNFRNWFYLKREVKDKIRIVSENISKCGEYRNYDKTITVEQINELNCRMILK